MNLREYIKKKGISISELSKLLELDYGHTHRLVYGQRWPSKKTALKILEKTNFEVSLDDLLISDISSSNKMSALLDCKNKHSQRANARS